MGRALHVPKAARLRKSALVAQLRARRQRGDPTYSDAVKEEVFGRWRLPPSFYDYTDYICFRDIPDFE